MPTFPSTLPNVQISNYGFAPEDANIRTDMEVGAARVRRRTTSAPTTMNVSWQFTLAQLGIFEKFYENDIFDGSAWFDIKLVNGVGETTYSARFKEPYKASTMVREFMWRVDATLEVLSRPLPAR